MMFRLVQEYLGDEELQRIAGISPGLPGSQAEIQGAYDFAVKFDVRELDSDYVIGKMKAIIDLLPIDTAGTVDRAKLMSIAVSMVDPVLGQSVMSDQRGATLVEQIFNLITIVRSRQSILAIPSMRPNVAYSIKRLLRQIR